MRARGSLSLNRRQADKLLEWGIALILILGGIVMMMPFAWMFSTSLRLPKDSFSLPPQWLPTAWRIENYTEVLEKIPLVRYILNTLKVAGLVTLGQLVTCSLAAYAFGRLRFPGRDILFLVFLSQLMIPAQVTIIPIFILIRLLGLLDTHTSLIVPAIFSAFGTFLLRQSFLTIPDELEDAARVDGAGFCRILIQIILPLSKPALASLAIFCFNAYWNEFFRPLLFLNSVEKMTLPLGLTIMRGYLGAGNTSAVMAGIAISTVPVVLAFLVAQRFLIEGVTLTGIKG